MKKPKTMVLDNGLTIMVIPVDSPSVTVMSLVATGSCYEQKTNNGISHFLEHMCFKGTEQQTGKDIMRYLDGLGAETNAFTSHELTGYYVKSTKKHWKKTLKVVSDIYLHSVFPEVEMEKEKGVIIGEISMYEDMPMRQVYEVFMSLVYGDQPAGWSILGPRENIQNMQRDDFLNYYRDHYVASATTLVVAGNVDPRQVKREVEQRFAEIGTAKKTTKEKTIHNQTQPRITIINKETDQTHLVIGYQSNGFKHKDSAILNVMGTILGGGMSSRLFEKLREDMGVGYYVRASNFTLSDTGIMTVSCGVDSTRVTEVLSAIHTEMIRLTTELVSDIELRKTQEFIIGNMAMGLESTDDVAYYYGQRSLFGLPDQTPRQFAQKIKSVTAADIRRVAKRIIKNDRLNIAMIGPHTDKDKKSFLKAMK